MCCSWRMPKPPWETGRQTVSHATSAAPRSVSILGPCQKKSRMTVSSRRRTPAGIMKMDMKKVGMADSTALSRTRRPPRDKMRALQPPSLDSTFSITGCQSRLRSRRSARGKPRYRIGNLQTRVARIRKQPATSSGESPKPMNADFARFRRRPEKSENISIMVESICAAAHDPWMKNVVSSAY